MTLVSNQTRTAATDLDTALDALLAAPAPRDRATGTLEAGLCLCWKE